MNRKRGFTLIELLVVIIIIGILAAVAAPIMRNSTKRAIIAEAVTALGTIRTAERAYFAVHNEYMPADYSTGDPSDSLPTIKAGTVGDGGNNSDGDLDGTYFSEECYFVMSWEEDTFTAYCYVYSLASRRKNMAPQEEYTTKLLKDPAGCYISINENGEIKTLNIPGSGYPDM